MTGTSKALGVLALTGMLLAVSFPAAAERYRVRVVNTWSEATHPGAFPNRAHFSWLGGATHDATVSFWDEGVLATPGMVQMAETGATIILGDEVAAAIAAGSAGSFLEWRRWFCTEGLVDERCGPSDLVVEIEEPFSRITLVTMLGPTPDWFVGVTGLALHDGNDWIEELTIDLRPYDGGTRDANAWALGGALTVPPEPVSLITVASGQLVGPASLGRFEFKRLQGTVPTVPASTPALGAVLVGGLALLGGLALSRRRG
jgi:hypothetical protein